VNRQIGVKKSNLLIISRVSKNNNNIAVESLGPMNWEARKFLADLDRKISRVSGDDRETTFLFQSISVLLFRFNSVLLHNSFELDDRSEH